MLENLSDKEKEYLARHQAATHAMQTGVLYSKDADISDETTPKHLRVGVNVALCDHGALAHMLIKAGVIKREDYLKAIAETLEADVKSYEKKLSDHFKTNIKLG